MNPKILSIHGLHDSSVTFVDKNNQIRIFEYERFCKKRYASLQKSLFDTNMGSSEESRDEFFRYIKINLKAEPEIILCSDFDDDFDYLNRIFPKSKVYIMGHHISHCAGAYYESGFDKALAISLDGGGLDYHLNNELLLRGSSIYRFDGIDCYTITHNNLDSPETFIFNPGIYGAFGYYVSEIKKDIDSDGKVIKNSLSYAGKLMGLAAYGKVRNEWIEPIKNFYRNHPLEHWNNFISIEEKLSSDMNLQLLENCFSEQDSYDLSATNQFVFEDLCFSFIKPYIDEYNLDVVFSGGCALNILFNQKLMEYLSKKALKLYIQPYPSDSGLSLGHFVHYQNLKIKQNPYCGIDIIDIHKLPYYYEKYDNSNKVKYSSPKDIVDLIKDGKIGGIIRGYSEVGPRALGNRSIICDPSYPEMKNVINSKVKFREWFRPFAPVCREEDKNLYFENAFVSPYMSFSPKVKEGYQTSLSSITHVDGTARLQTVNKEQNELLYAILTEMKDRDLIRVIMNTSFNIKGNPILSRLEDAFYVLENTELDFLVVENLLFTK